MVSHACMPSQPCFVSSDGSTHLCGLYFIRQYFKNSAGNIHNVIGDENWKFISSIRPPPHISCISDVKLSMYYTRGCRAEQNSLTMLEV